MSSVKPTSHTPEQNKKTKMKIRLTILIFDRCERWRNAYLCTHAMNKLYALSSWLIILLNLPYSSRGRSDELALCGGLVTVTDDSSCVIFLDN